MAVACKYYKNNNTKPQVIANKVNANKKNQLYYIYEDIILKSGFFTHTTYQ